MLRVGKGLGSPGAGRGRSHIDGDKKMLTLLDLMRKLASDAALAAEYEKDPAAVVSRAGLTDEEQKAMLAKDYASIKKLTGLSDGQFATNHIVKAY